MVNINQRTLQQNRSLHLYFTLLAEELNQAGYDMKRTLKPSVDIPWTPENVKEYLWRPLQQAYLNKESTTELTSDQIDKVYEVLNRHLGETTGVSVSFPSEHSKHHE